MGSNTMFSKVVIVILTLAAVLFSTPANRSAFAQQIELSGSWVQRNHEVFTGDILPVDYTGLALNAEGRAKSLSYSESQVSMIERQCQGWAISYLLQGPFGLEIRKETEPIKGAVISYMIGAWEDRPAMTIWMDGRPHPTDYDVYTRAGFTTGEWDGDTLVTRTTHVQASVQRNGVPSSDRTTMTMRLTRHEGILTVIGVIDDPVYFAEPMVFSRVYELSVAPILATGPPCITTYQGVDAAAGVPHYLPEKNPFVDEITQKFGVPRDAALGLPETLYPEYSKKLQAAAPAR